MKTYGLRVGYLRYYVSQLSRSVEQRQDIRESEQIELVAVVIGFLHRKNYYEK
ncbi:MULTISPECIES: DnaB-like helicase C-terminal domain-containing protein [Bacillus]|uniref:DnaB-like helicase C-terminal domain-containing protein n=1 Tax=Bacillus TaxID=1386 RepID=UPI001CBDA44C|nr:MULTISPECIES: DnaB-like helicase C-terminal domain-containing protein [Bacillus]UBQ48423.1 hypothetical protein LCH16_14400 [Bacillus velezensis]WGS40046.1 DnaB-like helicase C-terminal domain-containing protein [Bacillus velezensis]